MLTELEHGATAVITRHGVMHSFPEPLDDVDPGMIDGLEEQLELSICTQPPLDELALVDFVVVEDEYHLVGTPILPAKLLEQLHEQHRGLLVMLDPGQLTGMRV